MYLRAMVFARLFGNRERISGPPPSGNGASSFHLHWLMAPAPGYSEASVDLQVMREPAVDRLYFWALQATFSHRTGNLGGAHLGLQWNPRFPGNRAANWGGYDEAGRILEGTSSPLPSAPGDPNTRDYPWQASSTYRLRISPGDAGWKGEITDLDSDETVLLRELTAGGDRLTSLMVWSEVFADCDHPSVTAAWSGFTATSLDGDVVRPGGLRVNYQAYSQGGCSNTNVARDVDGVLQVTNAERTMIQGSVIPL